MRLLFAVMMIGLLTFAIPAQAQPRDEAPGATPVPGGAPYVAEEAKPADAMPAEEKPVEKKKPVDKKPAKKPAPDKKEKKKAEPKKEEKKKEEKKPEPAKEPAAAKEPEARKPAPAAASSGKDPVIVINPCTGDVSEELVAPVAKTKTIQPGKNMSCLTARQCDALCRVGESFGEGGGAPHLSPRGDIVFGEDAYTGFDDCVSACGPKCK